MGYEDPRTPNPQFPDRPSHRDYIDLSDVVQSNDLRADAGVHPIDILGIDQESLTYLILQRFGILSAATGGAIPAQPDALVVSLYIDAMALGKGLAETRARRGEIPD